MKPFICLLLLVPFFSFAEPTDALRDVVPDSFASTAEAEQHARKLFAGGKVRVHEIEGAKILVLQVLGSGVPVVAIATYTSEGEGWRLARVWRPVSVEFHRVEVADNVLFAIGEETGQRWQIFPVDTE